MSTIAESVIKINGLTKYFESVKVLDELTLRVKAGEIYGFIGPNGAGKTTTIRLLLGILRPNAGGVRLFGEPVSSISTRRRIGFLSSDMALDEELTGWQYLHYVAGRYGKQCDGIAAELATRLDAKLSVKIASYSRGNRQKLLLIAALMHEPELLIMDEPTSGFDPLIQEIFVQLIREFRDRGGTVFMSSHILGEVQQLCDRVGFIRAGKLVGETEVAAMDTISRKVVKIRGMQKLKGTLKGFTAVSRTDDVAVYSYHGDIKALLRYLAGQHVQDVLIEQPDLENEFIGYYR